MIMKQFRVKLVLAILATVGFFMVLGWAGDIDFCDQVILSMSQEEYDSVKIILMEQNNGAEPSDRTIAHYWVDHRR